jgi:poly-gamma-glutamate capsule biosynthesis protein CapA/YwtB (metallophosphatase superfamily)
MKIEITLNQEVQNLWISKTIAKATKIGSTKKISVYLISTKEFSGKFLIKAFDKDNQEIGRSKTDVVFWKDDAKYINFEFTNEIDMNLVKFYEISIVK